MWIVSLNMGEESHLVGSMDTEVEAAAFVSGYSSAIANHTADITKEEKENLIKQFEIRRIDDPKED